MPPPSSARVYSVAELSRSIREDLEFNYPDLWVAGEISNLRRPASGHCYFTLKDDRAQLRAVLWRFQASTLRFELQDGLEILAHGALTVYEPRGEYQLVADLVEPRGVGALQLAFEQLRARLEAEGLFDPARKRALPRTPRRVALITSPSGAAVRDFLKVLRGRFAGVAVLIFPVRVQGESAAAEIAAAIASANRLGGFDALIVCRGGGSIEDLWAFNQETVVRALAASSIPTVSAVGHEIDVTLADLVADLRAPTPSAAAEILVASQSELIERLRSLADRLGGAGRLRLQRIRTRIERLRHHRALERPRSLLYQNAQRIDELCLLLERCGRIRLAAPQRALAALATRLSVLDPRARLRAGRQRLVAAQALLGERPRHYLTACRARLELAGAKLEGLSPLRVLARGYSVTLRADRHTIVRRADQVAVQEELYVRLHRGSLRCLVTQLLNDSAGGTDGA